MKTPIALLSACALVLLCAPVHSELPTWCLSTAHSTHGWAHHPKFKAEPIEVPKRLQLSGFLDASWINAQGDGRAGAPSFQQGGVGLSLVAWPMKEAPVQVLLDAELLQRPVAFGSTARRDFFIEQAAVRFDLPGNFAVRAGVFLVPFGLEDDHHASTVNPLISRPEAMFGPLIYPGSWVDTGAEVSWSLPNMGQLSLALVNSDPANQRLAVQVLRTSTSALTTARQPLHNLGSDTQPNDTNASKSAVLRVFFDDVVQGVNVGGSWVYASSSALPDADALPSSLLGAHLDVEGRRVLRGDFWPSVRAEFVYGHDTLDPEQGRSDAWTRWGLYAQLLQPLPLRIDAVFRYEFVEPDQDTADDEFQAFAFGLRHEVYENVYLKGEYRIRDENRALEVLNNTALAQVAVAW